MTLYDLGFTEYQDRLYRALVADQRLGVGQLADLTGADDDTTRAELAGLVRIGALEADRDAAAGVRVVHPLSALRKHIERAEEELLRRQRAVTDARAELEVLSCEFTRRVPGHAEACERIEARDGARDVSVLAVRDLHAVRPGDRASIAANAQPDRQSLARGVALRLIHHTGVLADETTRAGLTELAAAGAEIRLTTEEPVPMTVVDGRVAAVPADQAGGRPDLLVVRHPGVTTALGRLFACLWHDAEPLHRGLAAPLSAQEVSAADRRLLDLLASGQTDEAAARALGISVRHLRRRIAALLRRLGAGSRFEAGVLAARRGWL